MDRSPEPNTYSFPLMTTARTVAYAHWKNGFTYGELKDLRSFCDALPRQKALTMGASEGAELTDTRDCDLSWIPMNDQTKWFHDKLAYYVSNLNETYFGFDLTGFEMAQYTVYEGTKTGSHYDWHIDCYGKSNRPQRKLSLVLQLSHPQEYEGGELWLHGAEKHNVPKEHGLLYAFPSYTLHRVTPTTQGVRRSIVVWCVGPEFR